MTFDQEISDRAPHSARKAAVPTKRQYPRPINRTKTLSNNPWFVMDMSAQVLPAIPENSTLINK